MERTAARMWRQWSCNLGRAVGGEVIVMTQPRLVGLICAVLASCLVLAVYIVIYTPIMTSFESLKRAGMKSQHHWPSVTQSGFAS